MAVVLKPENVIKTIDSLGRITLPKGLRDRMYINSENNELEIFTMDVNGKMYICLSSPDTVDNRLLAAAEVFREMGVEMPEKMQEKINAMTNNKKSGQRI